MAPLPAARLPSALDHLDAVVAGHRPPVVFLDYDGTLTPIVRRPGLAVLPEAARAALGRLSACCPVAVVSGRDRADVAATVGLPGLVYAGSHGFDIEGPSGAPERREGEAHRPALEAAREAVAAALAGVPAAWVEPKRLSFAVHFREAPAERAAAVEAAVQGAVEAALAAHPGLRCIPGKRVVEVQPRIDWDKGRAVRWLVEALGQRDRLPVYVGDDVTDEDAFCALRDDGVGILVRDGPEDARRTAARFAVDGPDDVRRLLEAWAGRLEAGGARGPGPWPGIVGPGGAGGVGGAGGSGGVGGAGGVGGTRGVGRRRGNA